MLDVEKWGSIFATIIFYKVSHCIESDPFILDQTIDIKISRINLNY
jgi:hypothetical protein